MRFRPAWHPFILAFCARALRPQLSLGVSQRLQVDLMKEKSPPFHSAEIKRHDFGLIRDQFDSLRVAMGNKLEREWPRSGKFNVGGGKALVLGLYKGAENALGASRMLMADTPPNPARKAEYALAASPLTRSILDVLCSIVFVFGDFAPRVLWYYKAGWREVVEETERLEAAYGSDPEWKENLAGRRELIEHGKTAFELTADEAAGLVAIKRWPIPERMLKTLPDESDRHVYIRYLIDWFYRTLSQEAHHSWAGLARSYPLLVPGQLPDDQRKHHLELMRTRQVNMSLTLMMAIITELELEFRFGLNERAKYVWSILREWSEEAKDIYDRFYRPVLGSADATAI